MSRVFVAQFRSRCAGDCGEPIRPGDRAEYLGEDLLHEECADDGPSDRAIERQLARAKTCPRCFVTHTGEC